MWNFQIKKKLLALFPEIKSSNITMLLFSPTVEGKKKKKLLNSQIRIIPELEATNLKHIFKHEIKLNLLIHHPLSRMQTLPPLYCFVISRQMSGTLGILSAD